MSGTNPGEQSTYAPRSPDLSSFSSTTPVTPSGQTPVSHQSPGRPFQFAQQQTQLVQDPLRIQIGYQVPGVPTGRSPYSQTPSSPYSVGAPQQVGHPLQQPHSASAPFPPQYHKPILPHGQPYYPPVTSQYYPPTPQLPSPPAHLLHQQPAYPPQGATTTFNHSVYSQILSQQQGSPFLAPGPQPYQQGQLPTPTAGVPSPDTTGEMPPRKAAQVAPPKPEIEPSPVRTKFPTARIKRIMQADDEVGKVSQQTPIAVGKALELFMINLVTKSADVARDKGQKRVSAQMLKQVIEADEQWDFLREIVGKVEGEDKAKAGGSGSGSGARVKAESDSDDDGGDAKKKGKGRKKKV